MTAPSSVPDRSRLSGEPQWIEPSLRVLQGADPLGIQTITTDRLMPRLLPAVLALSQRARYLSFYAFLLARYERARLAASQGALSAYMKRHEYDLALAVILCPRGCGSGPVGADAARPVARHRPAQFERRESVESHLGGYGLYYRSPMRELGLVVPAGTPWRDETMPIDVLRDERAQALGAAFDEAVSDTAYIREFANGDRPIPLEVIEEYAARACLCRLDEFTAERDQLRAAWLGPSDAQADLDTRHRREGFALFLDLLEREPRTAASDWQFRRSIWRAFTPDAPHDARGATVARWAAMAARDYAQEAVANLWNDLGTSIARADRGDGLSEEEIRGLFASRAAGTLDLPGGTVSVDPTLPTDAFRAAVADASRGQAIDELALWAIGDRSAVAGLALLLTIVDRAPDPKGLPSDWSVIAGVSGERQPGLTELIRMVTHHLGDHPSMGETMAWVGRNLVLIPHETTASSKLPDFTFRFRWELGRLHSYAALYDGDPYARFGLNDIRSSPLSSLSRDLGLAVRLGDQTIPTDAGRAYVSEVFGT